MIERATFEIAYTGPGVDGRMDIRDLAPALLAFGDLVESANLVIGDPKTTIKVIVQSNFEKGSFQVKLEIIHTLIETIKYLWEIGKDQTLPDLILTSLGLAGGASGLLQLLKSIKGRKITDVTILENGNTRLMLQGKNGEFEQIEVSDNVMKLYRNREVREQVPSILKPLEKADIDGFEVRQKTQTIERISKDERTYYDPPEIIDETRDPVVSNRQALVDIIEVPFQPNLKWKVSEGDNKFWASMEDQCFLERMEGREVAFSKGDILQVELETKQVITSSGVKSDYKIVKVVEHIQPPPEISLF
ncbi:MAG: hypothetical protein GXY34_15000 [Syntrophomonadaceae bacterium]|nr:hypothetical protein [Syntrophomonadaceae bacterium]